MALFSPKSTVKLEGNNGYKTVLDFTPLRGEWSVFSPEGAYDKEGRQLTLMTGEVAVLSDGNKSAVLTLDRFGRVSVRIIRTSGVIQNG